MPQLIQGQGNPVLSNLRQNVNLIGSTLIQKQLQEQQRKRELQDAVRKTLIEKALSGQVKGLDIQSLMSGGAMPDVSGLEISPDLSQMYKTMQIKRLNQQLGKQHRIDVLAGLEEPSEEDISALPETRQIFEQPKPVTVPGPIFNGQPTQIRGQATEMMGPPSTEEAKGMMKEKYAPGISKEDLARKALGVPFTGRATQTQIVAEARKMAEAEKGGLPATEEEVRAKIPTATRLLKTQQSNLGTIFKGQPIDITAESQYSEEEIDALKPDNIPQEDWDNATLEEKIEFLKSEGLL